MKLRENHTLFIGLMSGTSLDGVDGILVKVAPDFTSGFIQSLASVYIAFPADLRAQLMKLQIPGENEIEREALAANSLAQLYAECVAPLLTQANITADAICAIGVHGQTIRHRPDWGYTRQIGNAALLAELTGIDVIADFRSRDIAAGGQGAPLVPAFHQAAFGKKGETRVIANIGGISNISVLQANGSVVGFDTGPGNVLMDAWIAQHHGQPYDAGGAWAATGSLLPPLLNALRDENFFTLTPPKSTGRDLFNRTWLDKKLASFSSAAPSDVQATLTVFTATTLADAIISHAPDATEVYICGGGAYNTHLIQQLSQALTHRKQPVSVQTTNKLGVEPNHVEAMAFAWLAHRFSLRLPGNLPAATGARGYRILGALYPAR